ncbi:uncharacterized protein F5891DRAFT_1125670 [Suillus fuscotomentosus]|uniref:DUF6589 domain-containing protein n=1 Tax=Suillus fuscotomentosus TaxID=1912939 RepID=A0AAD4EHR4_9AGAM|nr:uncharacterized protein F5891DRAFT_1125670 [Suillus fuscotomentosus]KAG1906365.1 hypothetical protein F5891DRAFT_1125670 [Suillus fuscotomentosus]
MDEIKHLSSEEAGWHFGALHVTTKQLEAFSVDDMAIDMASCAPALWDLLGILMQGTNQKSNALQSILGIFLQSVHAPQKVIDTLSRIGISISCNTINAAIRSLSAESQNTLHALGQSMLACYAYDNFNVDLKSQVPLAEKSNDTLKHLTSSLLFPLQHGITLNDLKCSEALWRHAMDINNSTVTGNIQAVVSLLAQGGVHDPADTNLNFPDISQHVVLFHGDLGTGERLQAAQLRQSIEATPWNRLQHMACVDAIWRLFLQPLTAREDETSLMRDVTHLRPKETGIYCSKPGFRRMHQLVGHAGICWRLDCWRVYVKSKNPNYTSLDAFAASEPTINILQDIANELAKLYVAGRDLYQMCCQPCERRDEELSYAMNHGDIGRVETCIIPWIPILKATGKHKYATHMTNFLLNVHFVYPEGLRRAVRYHILVNPSGKEMKWRAVDWCVELNNLFTKVKNGGKGPNRTLERILLESPLVQAYRNAQTMIQKNFLHTHLTTNHAASNMTKTFEGLCIKMGVHSPHIVIPGRKSRHEIVDVLDKGRELMEKGARGETDQSEDMLAEGGVEMDDVLIELL